MPFPRVRFTVRRMMVAVMVVALALSAREVCRRRAAKFNESAQSHFQQYNELHHHPPLGPELSESGLRRIEAAIRWHAVLAKKYALAAERPWLPVAPDPPEPE